MNLQIFSFSAAHPVGTSQVSLCPEEHLSKYADTDRAKQINDNDDDDIMESGELRDIFGPAWSSDQ